MKGPLTAHNSPSVLAHKKAYKTVNYDCQQSNKSMVNAFSQNYCLLSGIQVISNMQFVAFCQ